MSLYAYNHVYEMCTYMCLQLHCTADMIPRKAAAMHTSPDQPTHTLSSKKNVNHSVNNCEEVVLH